MSCAISVSKSTSSSEHNTPMTPVIKYKVYSSKNKVIMFPKLDRKHSLPCHSFSYPKETGKKLPTITVGILYLSLLIVNEKQQEMTFCDSGSGFLRRQDVKTAF